MNQQMNGHLCCYMTVLKKVFIVLAMINFIILQDPMIEESLSPDDYEITEKFEMV